MEGPSLRIIKEEVAFLVGKKITAAEGTAKFEKEFLIGQRIKAFRTFGKHFLIEFQQTTIRIHFLMFGSYRVNESRDKPVRLNLVMGKHYLNFYSCAVTLLNDDLNSIYDWSADVLSETWDEKSARKKLKANPVRNVGDALLDQNIFAGVGNIIKCEVLFRISLHPNNTIGTLPPRKLTALIREARNYSFDFYEWKKIFQLRKHFLIYKKKKCINCSRPVTLEYTGTTKRRTFYCNHCQVLYKGKSKKNKAP